MSVPSVATTQGARFVSFRGPVGELPQGGDGSYGTSISLYKAVEDTNDVIIAYKQNGRRALSVQSTFWSSQSCEYTDRVQICMTALLAVLSDARVFTAASCLAQVRHDCAPRPEANPT